MYIYIYNDLTIIVITSHSMLTCRRLETIVYHVVAKWPMQNGISLGPATAKLRQRELHVWCQMQLRATEGEFFLVLAISWQHGNFLWGELGDSRAIQLGSFFDCWENSFWEWSETLGLPAVFVFFCLPTMHSSTSRWSLKQSWQLQRINVKKHRWSFFGIGLMSYVWHLFTSYLSAK